MKPNSTVLGEVYGKKHPIMEINNVEVKQTNFCLISLI